MQISVKPLLRNADTLLFLMVSLLFLLIYSVTFKGFNGTDDMHYSMLGARLLQHRFSPFDPTDVFCGRIGLVLVQSAIYRIAGITVFSTEAGTVACTLLCCWLLVFKLAETHNPVKTVLTTSLFYFAPTLVPAIRGIMPDAYIMLLLLLLFLFWRKIFSRPDKQGRVAGGTVSGIFIALSLLFKESAVLFVPLIVLLSLRYYRAGAWRFIFPMLTAFAGMVCVFGFSYYHFTGNFFFRATQIHNSQLIESLSPGSCNCKLGVTQLLKRLTFGPWKAFILQGFIPVLLPVFYLLLRTLATRSNRFSFSPTETLFSGLLLIILYFPANFQQYQPVCSDARQYLMLMPFGINVIAEPLYALFVTPAAKNKGRLLLPAAAAVLLGLFICLSPNKWKWLTYGLLLAGLLLPLVAGRRRPLFLSVCLMVLLATTGLERLFFFTNPWFNNLQTLQQQIGNTPALFPEHDNYIHWQFLCKYRNDNIYNLEPDPPLVLARYYPKPGVFQPGWFILNRAYTVRSATFVAAVDQLDRDHFFSDRKTSGDVSAFKVDSPDQLQKLKSLFRDYP